MIDESQTSKALFKNTGIIALGQISTKFINFLLMPLYTAILVQEEYGLADLLISYSSLLVVVVGLQLYQALFRYIVTSREDKNAIKSIVSSTLAGTFFALLIYSVLFLCVAPVISIEYKWFLLLSVYTHILFQVATNTVRGMGDNARYAFASFIAAAFTLACNIIGIVALHMGVLAMLIASIIGPLFGTVYLLISKKLYTLISIRSISKEELQRIIHYAIPLVPNELSWAVIHASDRFVISSFLTIAANGLIAVASKFSVIYTTFFSFFNTSWTEQVVLHYKDDGGPEYISSMFDKMVTFFASIAIGIIACMPFVFGFFVNANYNEAYGLIPFYLIAVFFNAVIGMISAIYLIHNETGKVALTTGVAAAVNMVTDILMVKYIGVYAAPISSILGYLTISVWRLVDVNKRHSKVTMQLSKVITLIVIVILTMVSYFSGRKTVQTVVLLVDVIVLLLINKSFLMEFVSILKRKKK